MTAMLFEGIRLTSSRSVSKMMVIMLSLFCIKLKTVNSLSTFTWSIWFDGAWILDLRDEPLSERFSLGRPSWDRVPCRTLAADSRWGFPIWSSRLPWFLSSRPPFFWLLTSCSIARYFFNVASKLAFSFLRIACSLAVLFCSYLHDLSSDWAFSTSCLISVRNRSWYREWISPMLLSLIDAFALACSPRLSNKDTSGAITDAEPWPSLPAELWLFKLLCYCRTSPLPLWWEVIFENSLLFCSFILLFCSSISSLSASRFSASFSSSSSSDSKSASFFCRKLVSLELNWFER